MNSFNQLFNACAFPSFTLSIEYVIVISGDIIIKNPIVSIRLTYENKNAVVIPTNIAYTISDPQDTVATPTALLIASCVVIPEPIFVLTGISSSPINALFASTVNIIM